MIWKDAATIWHMLRSAEGRSQQDRLDGFYSHQAEDYDRFREKLLPGRQELIDKLGKVSGNWADVGCGTGANLSFMGNGRCARFDKIVLVDLSKALLKQAQIKARNLKNVELVHEDVLRWRPENQFDLITMSYSLTMMPRWPLVLERMKQLLAPKGRIAVVDFYVSEKFPQIGFRRHSGFTRSFWPVWFSWDNVFLSPDHLPWLASHFKPLYRAERMTALPFLPYSSVPYYLFVGERRAKSSY